LERPSVAEAWKAAHGALPTDADIDTLFEKFIPMQLSVLEEYASPIPGVQDVMKFLHARGIQVGSTTGYIRSMMDVLLPAAEQRGYRPDCVVCPDDVPAGRPSPWMCYQNAMQLGIYPMQAMVKVGDTFADVEEGLNAGMWTVGLTLTGNLLGLNETDAKRLSPEDRATSRHKIGAQLLQTGAHYVIDGIWDLPGVLTEIESCLAHGERP
jgi:phosphonoacetaldehyde hydrolase